MIAIELFGDGSNPTSIRLDTTLGVIYSDDSQLATELASLAKEEVRLFGIVGTALSSGTDILRDPWATFLWLDRMGFVPKWVGKPPKVPKTPKGVIV